MAAPDVSDRSLTELFALTGRRALVTGGARGIGRAVAARLAEAGALVMIADLDKREAESAAASLKSAGVVRGAELDVTDSLSVAAAVGRVVQEFGGLEKIGRAHV